VRAAVGEVGGARSAKAKAARSAAAHMQKGAGNQQAYSEVGRQQGAGEGQHATRVNRIWHVGVNRRGVAFVPARNACCQERETK